MVKTFWFPVWKWLIADHIYLHLDSSFSWKRVLASSETVKNGLTSSTNNLYFTFKRESFLNLDYCSFVESSGHTLDFFAIFGELGIRNQIQKAAFGIQTKINLVNLKIIVLIYHVYIFDAFFGSEGRKQKWNSCGMSSLQILLLFPNRKNECLTVESVLNLLNISKLYCTDSINTRWEGFLTLDKTWSLPCDGSSTAKSVQ